MITYGVKLVRRYDGLFVATFPDVPEAMAFGRDDEEAFEEAQRALESALQGYVEEGRKLPRPKVRGGLGVSTPRFSPAMA